MEALDTCLYVGVKEYEFWEMTFGEVTRLLKAKNKKEQDNNKKESVNLFMLARMIADNVSCLIDNEHKPKEYMELFGHLYSEEEKAQQEEVKEDKEAILQAEKFKMFAELQNRNRKK